MDERKKQRLGRGLDALLGDYSAPPAADGVQQVDVYLIDTNPEQPRKSFDAERLNELADSIKRHGMVQPIIARKNGDRFTIIAGERRFRASRLAGLSSVPVVVREMQDDEVMEIALIENIQREDLNPIEEAAAIRFLMTQHDLTQEEVSERLAKSRPAIANSLRLLNLPQAVRDMVSSGDLTAGHARAIGGLKDERELTALAKEIVERSLSVREAEARARELSTAMPDASKPARKAASKPSPAGNADLTAAAERMQEALNTRVNIVGSEDTGRVVISYYSKDDLQAIYDLIVG